MNRFGPKNTDNIGVEKLFITYNLCVKSRRDGRIIANNITQPKTNPGGVTLFYIIHMFRKKVFIIYFV